MYFVDRNFETFIKVFSYISYLRCTTIMQAFPFGVSAISGFLLLLVYLMFLAYLMLLAFRLLLEFLLLLVPLLLAANIPYAAAVRNDPVGSVAI